jgi:hypothetical protein
MAVVFAVSLLAALVGAGVQPAPSVDHGQDPRQQ